MLSHLILDFPRVRTIMSELWQYEFMRYALISATILGPTCALLGVFVTLRGMAFFSDALAHSAITGVALGFLIEESFGLAMNPLWVVLVFSLGLAALMARLGRSGVLAPDTVIAFSFTGSVALGVVLIAMLGKYRMLDSILFGSVYANDIGDIGRQLVLAFVVGSFVIVNMRSLALTTLNPEAAQVQRLPTFFLHYGFALLIAATVVVSLKMLGALLLSALIVIPAAAGKVAATSFRSLLVIALSIGLLASWAGVISSFHLDTPTGPTIVLSHIAFLLMAYAWRTLRPR